MGPFDDFLQQAIQHHRAGRTDVAEKMYQKVLDLDPRHADAMQLLGAMAHQQGRHAEAAQLLKDSLAIDPSGQRAWNNLGEALRAMGQLAESVDAFRRALALNPGYSLAHSNLLLTLQSDPAISPRQMLEEHAAWGRAHADPLARDIAPHLNDANPDRKLRIGYVSPDFRRHSVAYFAEPLIGAHDKQNFEITCYHSWPRGDEVTARIKAAAGRWREVASTPDELLAQQIRQDHIDILVDLTGHMAKNRLLTFARKPAPVQMTYLGYPNTTGVRAIDYRLTDELSDPAGVTDAFHTEKLLRLPTTLWCYQPPTDSPEVLPRRAGAPICFGSFNKYPKHTPQVVRLWARILRELPGSRFLLKCKSLSDPGTRKAAEQMFVAGGMDPARMELRGWDDSVGGHFDLYNQIDIALDPLPYNGTTTTCEALWMGKPIVALAGETHVARVSVSLLTNAGLNDLIARNEDDYVRIAVSLAQDANRLNALRNNLREMMRESPLMDAVRFARDVECAYRNAWKTWCTGRAAAT